uniref:Uncharacterized protein n=1 Tax=Aegilops tauschii subsp. strangulata TaxID=200361 RepID=A0A453JNZ3_AEGTS
RFIRRPSPWTARQTERSGPVLGLVASSQQAPSPIPAATCSAASPQLARGISSLSCDLFFAMGDLI